MHEPLLAKAALPAPTRICGIPLRPYSLGHELFLIRESNPFAVGGPILPGDLQEAIWICAMTFKACRRAHASLMYLPALMALKWRVGRSVKRGHIIGDISAFRAYRADGCL